MNPERLIMKINIVKNYISDNFYFDHKAVRSNLTELFFYYLLALIRLICGNRDLKKIASGDENFSNGHRNNRAKFHAPTTKCSVGPCIAV